MSGSLFSRKSVAILLSVLVLFSCVQKEEIENVAPNQNSFDKISMTSIGVNRSRFDATLGTTRRIKWDQVLFNCGDYNDTIRLRPLIDQPRSLEIKFKKTNFYKANRRVFLHPFDVEQYNRIKYGIIAKNLGIKHQEMSVILLEYSGQKGFYLMEENLDKHFLEKEGISSSAVFSECYDLNDCRCNEIYTADTAARFVISEKLKRIYKDQSILSDAFEFKSMARAFILQSISSNEIEGMRFWYYYSFTNGKVEPIFTSPNTTNRYPENRWLDFELRESPFSILLDIDQFRKILQSEISQILDSANAIEERIHSELEIYAGLLEGNNSIQENENRIRQKLDSMSSYLKKWTNISLYQSPIYTKSVIAQSEQSGPLENIDLTNEEFVSLAKSELGVSFHGDTIKFDGAKIYNLTNNVIIPKGFEVSIEAGCKIYLDSAISLLSYSPFTILGTASNHVLIRATDCKKPFGSFAFVGNDYTTCRIEYLDVSCGKESRINGLYFSGALSLYHTNVKMKNCNVFRNVADDGLNIKYGEITLENCHFYENYADQVDLDFCTGIVKDCAFDNNKGDSNGDGLDFSGSEVTVRGCYFDRFNDKGISIGEFSLIQVDSCQFFNNNLGIAIKDFSILDLRNSELSTNNTDISLYRKKQIFGGGTLNYFDSNIFDRDSMLIIKDKYSIVNY